MDVCPPLPKSCAEQLVDALSGESVDAPLTWNVTVPSLLAASAAYVEELTWNIQTILLEAAHRISRRTDPTLLTGIATAAHSYISFSNCRESIMLAQSACRQVSNLPSLALTVQEVCLGAAACANRPRGVPATHVVECLKVLHSLTVSKLSGTGTSLSREERRLGISLVTAAVLALWPYREVATRRSTDDGVAAMLLMDVHFALAFFLLIRACIIWSVSSSETATTDLSEVMQGSLHMLQCELAVDFADLVYWNYSFSTEQKMETPEPQCTAAMCARLAWIQGANRGAGYESNPAEDSDEDESSDNPLLRRWYFKTRETSAFRSGIAHLVLAGLTSHSEGTLRFELPDRTKALLAAVPLAPATAPSTSLFYFPFVYSSERLVTLLLPVLHQFSSEHAALIGGTSVASRHQPSADRLRAILGVISNMLSATPECCRSISNVNVLHVPGGSHPHVDAPGPAGPGGDNIRRAPLEVHMLQSLFTCVVREPEQSIHNELLMFAQHFLGRLTGTAFFHIALGLLESCPFQTVSALLIDHARSRTSTTSTPSGCMLSIHHLNNIVVLAIDCRLRIGLVMPANVPRSSQALNKKQRAEYLSSNADMDIAILSAIRLIALHVKRQPLLLKANAADLSFRDMKVLESKNIQEFSDLFAQPLVNSVAESQEFLRESHGIMALHAHPAAFVPVVATSPEPQPARHGGSKDGHTLSRLFLLDAAATPTLHALEDIRGLLNTT